MNQIYNLYQKRNSTKSIDKFMEEIKQEWKSSRINNESFDDWVKRMVKNGK